METKNVSEQVCIPRELFEDMLKLKEDIESTIETAEIMSDTDLLDGIRNSLEEVKKGRLHELKRTEVGGSQKFED